MALGTRMRDYIPKPHMNFQKEESMGKVISKEAAELIQAHMRPFRCSLNKNIFLHVSFSQIFRDIIPQFSLNSLFFCDFFISTKYKYANILIDKKFTKKMFKTAVRKMFNFIHKAHNFLDSRISRKKITQLVRPHTYTHFTYIYTDRIEREKKKDKQTRI